MMDLKKLDFSSNTASLSVKIGCFFYISFVGLYWTTELPAMNMIIFGLRLPYTSIFLLLSGIFALSNFYRVIRVLNRIPFYLFMSMCFLLFVAISSLANESGIKAFLEFSIYLLIPVVLFLLAHNPNTLFRLHLYAFMINGFIIASIGLFRLFSGRAKWVELIDHELYGLGSRNLDAFFIMLGFLACFLLISNEKSRKKKVSFIMISITCFVGVILSLSRGMLLTAILATAILFLSSLRIRSYLVLTGFVFLCLATVGLSYSDLGERVTNIAIKRFSLLTKVDVSQTKEGIRSSVPGRIKLISLSFKAISENPLVGLGPGGFQRFAKKHHIRIYDSHNNFLLVWTEFGTFAFLAYFLLSLIPIILCLKLKNNPFLERQNIAISYGVIAFAFIFTSFFTNYVTYFGYWIVYALFFTIYPYFGSKYKQAF